MLCLLSLALSGCSETETQTPGLWRIEVTSTAAEPVSVHLTVEKAGTEMYTERFTLQNEEAITVTREWMRESVNYDITLEIDNGKNTAVSTENFEFGPNQCADIIFKIEDGGTILTFVDEKNCSQGGE
jgi:hypothetical protein